MWFYTVCSGVSLRILSLSTVPCLWNCKRFDLIYLIYFLLIKFYDNVWWKNVRFISLNRLLFGLFNLLTFTTLWAKSAGDKLTFYYFSLEISIDILYEWSPVWNFKAYLLATIGMKRQSLFSRKNNQFAWNVKVYFLEKIRNNISKWRLLNSSMLSDKSIVSCRHFSFPIFIVGQVVKVKMICFRKACSLRKHAYSNILKNLPPKKWKFPDKKFRYFSNFGSKHQLWVLVRTASTRWF